MTDNLFEFKLFIFICVYCFCAIICYCKKRSGFAYCITFFACWVCMALSTDSADLSNYRRAYDHHISRGKERVFDWIQDVAIHLDISFDLFRVLWGTAIILLLFFALKKYTRYYAFMLAVFVVVPYFTGFITQLRSSLAGAIVIYAVPYLFRNTKKDNIRYIVLILAASCFHVMAVFYFLLLLPNIIRISFKKYHGICLLSAAVLTAVMLVSVSLLNTLLDFMLLHIHFSQAVNLIHRVKFYYRPEMRSNMTGFLFASMHQIVIYVLAFRAYKRVKRNKFPSFGNVQTMETMAKLNDTMLLLIPFYVISMQMTRFFYYFLPVCYSMVIQSIMDKRISRNDRYINAEDIAVLAACTLFVYAVGIYGNTEEFVRTINGMKFW